MGGQRNRVLGRCAGLLFLSGAFASLPANLLLTAPRPEWWIYAINSLGALTGLACLLVPWHRIHRRWLHVIPPVATAEIVLSVVALRTHGDVFFWFWVLSSVFTGYAYRRRGAVAVHMSVASGGLVGTAIYASAFDNDAIARALVGVPTVLVAAGVVVWLRENLERRERTDPLTGLGNRRALMDALEDRDAAGTLVLFDLDGFKSYNDRFGHAAGDDLLELLGERLRGAVAGKGEAFRLGGDELCVLLDDDSAVADCAAALREGEISASYGSARMPEEAATPSEALRLADERMYALKRARRGAPFLAGVKEPQADPARSPASALPRA